MNTAFLSDLLNVIAVVVIGGASLSGGVGSMGSTFIVAGAVATVGGPSSSV